MTAAFPCTSCGACCRRISLAVAYHGVKPPTHPLHFPYSWDEEGVCEHLRPDNTCRVYEIRPLICNVEAYARYIGADMKSFFALNAKACNKLMDADGLEKKFRINT